MSADQSVRRWAFRNRIGVEVRPLASQPHLESFAANVEEVTIEGVDVFVLRGEFDAFTTPMLGDKLEAAIERGVYEIVIDMCAVTFTDVSTLNRIARAMQEVYRHNGHLVL